MAEMAADDLQQAARDTRGYRIVHREIPTAEGPWTRGGDLARVKLSDLEAALPAGLAWEAITGFAVVAGVDGTWTPLPFTLDYTDGYGRWVGGELTPDTLLCFHAPADGPVPATSWEGAEVYDGVIPLKLWDSRSRAWRDGVHIYYRTGKPGTAAPASMLTLEATPNGYAVREGGATLAHFAADRGYQLDAATVNGHNLISAGRGWRWLLTETTDELSGARDAVTFTPRVTAGPVLVVTVAGQAAAGRMTATLRVFRHQGALVLEFSDYRAVRTRPELPPEQHTRCYAGQTASPYPGVRYAALMLEAEDGEVRDHLYRYGALPAAGPLDYVYYNDERRQRGWAWLALATPAGVGALTVHGRTHFPDHPFLAGTENGRRVIALEPFGSEVDGHFHSCDRYMLVLAPDVETVRETFDTLDTYPLLAAPPLRRGLAFLDTYECLRRWTNLCLTDLLCPDAYRHMLRTNGAPRDDADTCLLPVGEMIRLYEKTGWAPFRATAEAAAAHVAEWILAGRFASRGTGIDPNGGGIYQNEQIYLLLSLARVWRLTRDPRLADAIAAGVQFLQDTRGGVGTWNWENFAWHAGGFGPDGQALYYWPVNSNQFATLCFRLYQFTGEQAYYDQAMEIVEAYLQRIKPDSWEIIMGGGVSDTTRGVHFLAEVLEVAGDDPRVDRAFWTEAVRNTLERFWVEGWIFVRHSIYGEVIHGGDTPGEPFSPGFDHWHNCGSSLDIIPRMQVAAETGVSEYLTRWAMRDFALDFDVRYGVEEHTHLPAFSMRDTDIEPACWLDCELLPTLFATRARGWVGEDEFRLLHYKIHRMMQRAFISLDDERGGWAAAYDSHGGDPVKYLNYWESRHSFARFAPGEPRELCGVVTRDAFYDHSTHYWNPFEQLVDELVRVEPLGVVDGVQHLACHDDGLGAGLHLPRPLLAPKEADRLELAAPWRLTEQRTVRIAGTEFWLCAVEQG